jgi:hypothetical protein
MQQTNDQAFAFANNIITQNTANSLSLATASETTKTTKSQTQDYGFSLPSMTPTPGSTSVVKSIIGPQTFDTVMNMATPTSAVSKQYDQKITVDSTVISTSAINLFDSNKQTQLDFTAVTQESKFSLTPPSVAQQSTSAQTATTDSTKPGLKYDSNTITNSQQFVIQDSNDNNRLGLKPGLLNLTEQKSVTQLSTTTEEKPTSVNKNAQPNELSAGVTLTAIATQPVGYDAYSAFTLKDAAFYAPKEIYKNQKTIDNASALRRLSSDILHQEMIDQQYKGK